MMEQLRLLKGKIEGSYVELSLPPLDSACLSQLKRLVLSQTPATCLQQHKAKLAETLSQLLDSRVKRIVYACLLTCPWFASAQSSLQEQTRNNVLFAVYVSLDEQTFSMTAPHDRKLIETIDQVS